MTRSRFTEVRRPTTHVLDGPTPATRCWAFDPKAQENCRGFAQRTQHTCNVHSHLELIAKEHEKSGENIRTEPPLDPAADAPPARTGG